MLRLIVIDSLYSTNAEYSYFSFEEMANAILDLGECSNDVKTINDNEIQAIFSSIVEDKPHNKRDAAIEIFSKQYGIRKNCCIFKPFLPLSTPVEIDDCVGI